MTGSEFRHRRLRLGWSRDQIAHSIGVPAEAIQRWENEESTISCPAALEQILRQTESASERFAGPADRERRGTSDESQVTRYE
jgi:transcriptional regulator with XRE-family HTH domain